MCSCNVTSLVIRWRVFVCVYFALPLCVIPDTVSGELTIEEIIENIYQHEKIYVDSNVSMSSTYKLMDKNNSSTQSVIEKNVQVNYVSQGEYFRIERAGYSRTSKSTNSRDRIHSFDGSFSRILEQNSIGNINHSRLTDGKAILPHMMLLRPTSYSSVPLSVFLSGHEAIRSHPDGMISDGKILQVMYDGEYKIKDLNCHKVIVTSFTDSNIISSRREIWLAENRNYLPVKQLFFRPKYSNDIPVAEGIVNEFREISEGVWFPFDAKVVKYNQFTLQREGKQELRWTHRYLVESAELDPTYNRDYFTNVNFPDGTSMYEVKDGEIIKSWMQGAPETGNHEAGNHTVKSNNWWILALNLFFIFLLAVILIIRKRSVKNDQAISE